jgi:tetratricopeptide (TPR) repeat protein
LIFDYSKVNFCQKMTESHFIIMAVVTKTNRVSENSLSGKENFDTAYLVRITLTLVIFLSIIPFGSSYVWFESIFCALIFLLFIFRVFPNKNLASGFGIEGIALPILVLGLYSFLQGFFTLVTHGNSPYLPFSYDPASSFWSAVKILAFLAFLKLIHSSFRQNTKPLVWSLVTTGNFIALLAILRFVVQNRFPEAFDYFIFPQLKPGIGFGTFINQNHFAYLMLMSFGLDLGLLWWGKLDRQKVYLLIICCLTSWTALVLTASRGGIISSFGMIAFLIFFPFGKPVGSEPGNSVVPQTAQRFLWLKRGFIFGSISLILVFGIIYVGNDRVLTRFEKLPQQFEDVPVTSSFIRKDVYLATVEIIKENLFYGVGFGGFRYAVSQHLDAVGDVVPEQTHNDYLEYLASGGLVAAGLGAWFIFNLLAEVRKRFLEPQNAFEFAARIGAIGGIVGISIHNLFDFSLQLFANLLFCGGLLIVAVAELDQKGDFSNGGLLSGLKYRKFLFQKIFVVSVCVLLCAYTILFGISRFQHTHGSYLINGFKGLPFDAELYETEATKSNEAGNEQDVERNLRKAIEYRQNDYTLWSKLGSAQISGNQLEEAEKSLRKAVELAPFYRSPRFDLGKFLIETDRRSEGFQQLRAAFFNNPQFFYKVADVVWKKTGKNGRQTIEFLSPLSVDEAAMLDIYFFEEKAYSAVVEVTCRFDELPQEHRNDLVQKFLENRLFYFAYQVHNRDCSNSREKITKFENGDFTTGEIDDRIGFGWRVNNLPNQIKLDVDSNGSGVDLPNLGIYFGGNYDPVLPIITQLLTVEHNQKYRVEFSYKTSEIVTGGIPVLLLIPKNRDSDGSIIETKLLSENSVWTRKSIDFETDVSTEAIEVRLTRKSCDQQSCPIFGRLQITDFKILKR